jgi:hypothetical protein
MDISSLHSFLGVVIQNGKNCEKFPSMKEASSFHSAMNLLGFATEIFDEYNCVFVEVRDSNWKLLRFQEIVL